NFIDTVRPGMLPASRGLMRHSELRSLFLALAATATPASVVVAGCGGTVVERIDGTGGQPEGGPVFAGQRPAGAPNGSGAVFMGLSDSAAPPMYVGSGGATYYGLGGATYGG